MNERAEVLFANDAFYAAFDGGDLTAMDRLWARDSRVACIHPGWPALSGREEVMESWRNILMGESAPDIDCHKAEAFLNGESAFVICYEMVGGDLLIATNHFVREEGEWRMTHHHAGPCSLVPESLGEPDPPASIQ